MKSVLSVKEKATFGTIGSLKSAYRRGFSRGLALGLVLLAVFIVLSGGLLYGQASVDALFIDEKGTVKVQDLKATGIIDAKKFTGDGSELIVEGGENIKKELNKRLDRTGGEIKGSLTISDNGAKGLYIKGNFESDKGVEFRHKNESQGIGFGFNTIYATGYKENQNLNLKPQKSGKVNVQGDLNATGLITGDGSRIKIYIKSTTSSKEFIYLDDLVSLLVKIGRTKPPSDNRGWANALGKTSKMWQLMHQIPGLVKTED